MRFHDRWRVRDPWIPLDDMQRVQGSIYPARYSSGETADYASSVTRREDTTMRQVVLRAPRDVDVVEADGASVRDRPPSADDALVRLRLAGLCGSDLAAYRGTSPLVSYPRVLGHELLVDVLEAPARPALVNTRAVVEPLLPCRTCRVCRVGRSNCCPDLQVLGVHADGGMQERMCLPAHQLYPVPDSLDDDTAVLAEPLSIAFRTVQRSGIGAGEVAVVMGAGPIGLLIAQLLVKARGCRALVCDLDASRLALAERLGAVAVPGDAAAQVDAVARATDGEMAACVFEATGAAACVRLTTELVRPTGRIVLVGWSHAPVEVDTISLMRKEAEIVGSRNSTGAFPSVLRLLEAGVVDANTMITHRFPFERAPEALHLLDRGEPTLKVVVAGP
jgi:L-gulonate 5-dehydrogenase